MNWQRPLPAELRVVKEYLEQFRQALCELSTTVGSTMISAIMVRSLFDNIRYGSLDATDEEVQDAARYAHAHEFISALPQGYGSLVGERGVRLSGGQRQRVAIARAVLKNAPIFFLDEATSSLDSVTERHIQDSIAHLLRGRTSIVIAHRLLGSELLVARFLSRSEKSRLLTRVVITRFQLTNMSPKFPCALGIWVLGSQPRKTLSVKKFLDTGRPLWSGCSQGG